MNVVDKGVISMFLSEEFTHSKRVERNHKTWSQVNKISLFFMDYKIIHLFCIQSAQKW